MFYMLFQVFYDLFTLDRHDIHFSMGGGMSWQRHGFTFIEAQQHD
jgi:hypothetical protein